MNNNVYGIDLGTCNFKIFCKATGKILKEKNAVAVINKKQIYAYGDEAYAMYEKAPESISVVFPVTSGVIADYNFLQSMIITFLEEKMKTKLLSLLLALLSAICLCSSTAVVFAEDLHPVILGIGDHADLHVRQLHVVEPLLHQGLGNVGGVGNDGIVKIQHQQLDAPIQQKIRSQIGHRINDDARQHGKSHRYLQKVILFDIISHDPPFVHGVVEIWDGICYHSEK